MLTFFIILLIIIPLYVRSVKGVKSTNEKFFDEEDKIHVS
jgi:hypothetical protein